MGSAIGNEVRRVSLPIYSAAIMPDHVHMVIARSDHDVEYWVGYFKRAASRGLRTAGLHPFAGDSRPNERVPSVWADDGWKVFLNTPDEIRSRIVYVERNPTNAGMAPQMWDWVTPYDVEPSRGRDG